MTQKKQFGKFLHVWLSPILFPFFRHNYDDIDEEEEEENVSLPWSYDMFSEITVLPLPLQNPLDHDNW